jgi:hypothetical protein
MEQVDRTQYTIKQIEDFLRTNGDSIKAEIEKKLNIPAARQDFRLAREQAGWTILETSSAQAVQLMQLEPFLASLPAAP